MIALAKDLLKYALIAGIGLYLLLGVIRPAFRNFSKATAAAPAAASRNDNAPQAAAAAPDRSAAQAAAKQSYENNLDVAKKLAGEDPKIVASVVQGWVNSNE
jgi:flagellar M-ring protein FliF